MLLQEEISILSGLSHKMSFKIHSDWLSVSFLSYSEVAFVISEEEAKTVEVLEGITALIGRNYYGCLS